MTDPREPEGGPDALDEAYRRASAADPSRPSEQARAAILANARAVAAAARKQAELTIDTRRPAANDPFWWRSAAASVAVAVVGLMIWAPHFEPAGVQSPVETAAKQESVASAPAAAPVPAVSAAAQDRALTAKERRLDEFSSPLGRAEAPRRLAAPAPTPMPRESAGAPAAPAPAAPPILAEPAASANLSAGAPASAPSASPAADALPAAVPETDQRAAAPSAPPAAPARKPELQEIIVTGGRARAATSSSSPAAAPPKSDANDSVSNGAVGGFVPDPGSLDAAIASGDAERVRALVAPRGALEARDARGRTPLMRAVEAGQAAVVRVLLDAGADPNARDADGATPHAKANRADIAALLEERGGH